MGEILSRKGTLLLMLTPHNITKVIGNNSKSGFKADSQFRDGR
jgi:hypothetical protein